MNTPLEEKEITPSLEGISLLVADVEKSVAFYSKLPGAQLIMHRTGQFAKFRIGDGHIQMVGMPPEGNTFHIELDASGLQGLYEHLRAAGIEPDGPPAERFFGRTNFRVHDPDGNILEFDSNEA